VLVEVVLYYAVRYSIIETTDLLMMDAKTSFYSSFLQIQRKLESITYSPVEMEEVFNDVIDMVSISEGLDDHDIKLLREFLLQFMRVHSNYSLDPKSKWHHIRFHLQHIEFKKRPACTTVSILKRFLHFVTSSLLYLIIFYN